MFEGMLDSIYDLCEAGNYKEAMFLFHSTAKSFEYKSPQFIAKPRLLLLSKRGEMRLYLIA